MKFLRVTMLWILLLPQVFTITGAASNQLVLWANNDKFPVQINPVKLQTFTGGEAVSNPDGSVTLKGGHFSILPDGTIMTDPTHCVMTKKTHLNLLADIIDLHDSIESVGDILLDLGTWLASFCMYVWAAFVLRKLWAFRH